jgi:hypothetical protein
MKIARKETVMTGATRFCQGKKRKNEKDFSPLKLGAASPSCRSGNASERLRLTIKGGVKINI